MAKQKGKLIEAWQKKGKPMDKGKPTDSKQKSTGAEEREKPKLKDQWDKSSKRNDSKNERGQERSRERTMSHNQGPKMN